MIFSDSKFHMEPRIVCYLRVSTDEQSHDSQRAQLEQYCERRGWRNRVGWFSDVGSGAKHDRGALKIMMDEVREGTVDVVLTWKIDRLARSLSHLAQIIAELQTHKVALVCPSQGIDTTDGNPCAQFQLNILAAVAQFERELITERVNAGLAAAKQRGVKLGRPSNRENNREPVLRLLESGSKTADISRLLSLPYSTVAEIVRDLKSSRSSGV
jgi:DNA invertase Pin-like site-specific DNA recombinase